MNRKIPLLISVMMFTGLFVGGCTKAATPVPTATSTITPSPAPTVQPGDSKRTLSVDGLERSYLLHVPPGVAADQPLPLVMVFGGHLETMILKTGFSDLADAHGFLVVYLIAFMEDSWNVGGGNFGYAGQKNIDEEAFVRDILSNLGAIVRIDTKRIYATGIIQSAILSYRLGCEMSDTFAAIAPVNGWLLTNPCQPEQPVSVIHVHGLTMYYAGGSSLDILDGTNIAFIIPPVEQGIATWVELDGCTGVAQVEKQGVATHTVYSSCRAGTAVELYTIESLGSEWPSLYAFPTFSSQMIWDFFAAHPKS